MSEINLPAVWILGKINKNKLILQNTEYKIKFN